MGNNRWDTQSKEVLEAALEIVADITKNKELSALKYENKNLKFEVEFLRNHIIKSNTTEKENT
jgi:hypothetical protein